MNAIVSLCHFCEAHGPGSVFSTQTLRLARIDEQLFDATAAEDAARKGCAACHSIDAHVGLLSQDSDSDAHFVSSQTPVLPETVRLVQSAATRSLSCEVSSTGTAGRERQANDRNGTTGGFVFFGDATNGHVFSHTFQIRDAQARGFYRLFSIVVLMRDKSFLLNIQPFLADGLGTISRRLQDLAFATYTGEQSASGQSERARRLNAGQANTQAPRSLAVLTGEAHVFGQLHTHFAWLLWAGARCLREIGAPTTAPAWIDARDSDEGFAMVRLDRGDWLRQSLERRPNDDDDDEDAPALTLRRAKDMLGTEFVAAVYCALVGVQIVLRGPADRTTGLMRCLCSVLPARMQQRHSRSDAGRYLAASECRLLAVGPEVAVPQPQAGVFRVDFVRDVADDEQCIVKWTGQLPSKLPDLLLKIVKAVNERLFNEYVLEKHLALLVEEWKNKISCLAKITSNQDAIKMKKILGILPQDQMLVAYWSIGL